MTNYTLVSSAVRAYETGKSYSRGFRYGAEMVESVARPVVRRFEPLEGFALRQLDRLERRSSAAEAIDKRSNTLPPIQDLQTSPQQQASLLHNVISNASGLTVAMSDESLKSLRYCLTWLKYANGHLDQAITTLNTIVAEQRQHDDALTNDPQSHLQSQTEQRHRHSLLSSRVSETKADIVSTIRKVVGVVSTYAGSALPEPARTHVRTYVLELPARWAQASASMPASRRTSESSLGADDGDQSQHATEQASRVIVLASEALQMLGGVTHIVGDTLERAEGWCNRLGRHNESSTEDAGATATDSGMDVDKSEAEKDGEDSVMQD